MQHRKRRILFLIPSLDVGGAERQTVQQVNALHQQGHMVLLCILGRSAPLLDQIQIPEKQIYVLKAGGTTLTLTALLGSLKKIGKLIRICRSRGVTHIIANLPLGHWYGRLIKLSLPSIRLLTYHRSLQYAANPLDSFAKKFFNGIQAVLAKRTDDVSICISQAVRENISCHFPLNNPVVVYNSVPDRYAETASTVPAVHHHQCIRLVLPGRMHRSKGHLFFLPVCRSLLNLFPQKLCFHFAGGGPLEKQVQDYISTYSLHEKISVTGYIPNQQILNEIYQADLVIIPSLHEGLGNVAIEALMLGKTVLASDAGGLKEIIVHGKNGYLFPAGNEQDCLSLCHCVLENLPGMLIDPQLLRSDFQDRFSFAAHIKQLTALLEWE